MQSSTQPTIPANLGAISGAELSKLTRLDPMEAIPTVMPAKEGFEAGKTFAGYFVETRRVVSEKLTTGKRNESGEKYANLHILRDVNGNNYGIWGKGQLDYLLSQVIAGQFVAVTYLGQADKALQKGQTPPHQFEVRVGA